ncbi:MAG: tetratricopeptide repeat protein [Sphingobacteriaceae bacterium]|nr:tetratricopeptide repeat protein [Sphingobacteriaceae bacterium]
MRSLQIMDSLNYKQGQANVYSTIANIYFTLGDIKKAQANAETGLKLARELGYPKEISSCGIILADVYQRTGNFKDAFFLFVRSKKIADSLNNDDLRRETLQKDLQHEYDRKVVADSLNLVLERHSNELKVKEEKNKRFFLYGGLVVLLFVTIFVFNRLRITKKQNEIIAKQKLEVESQK